MAVVNRCAFFACFRFWTRCACGTAPVTARQIAGDCGISLRTACRDLADLQAIGVPIRGQGGIGYVLEQGYFLPPLYVDADELEALALGAAAQRALAKIAGATRSEPRAVLTDPILGVAPSVQALAVADLATMRRAIRERRMTEIDYLSLSGEPSQRLARPLGLTVFDHAWLLTIWCETANGFRHLRADRIRRFHPLLAHFRPESGKRLADCHRIEGRGPANAPGKPGKAG